MGERGEGGDGWMGEWHEAERRGQGCMDGGVGGGREDGTGSNGCGSAMRDIEKGGAGWMRECDEGHRKGLGLMDA